MDTSSRSLASGRSTGPSLGSSGRRQTSDEASSADATWPELLASGGCRNALARSLEAATHAGAALSAAHVLAFHQLAPGRLRWDAWRFPALVLGLAGLTDTTVFWLAVAADPAKLPVGTALGGLGDTNGDMNRLMDVHGWTAEGLAHGYGTLALAAFALIAVQYLVGLAGARRRGSGGTGAERVGRPRDQGRGDAAVPR